MLTTKIFKSKIDEFTLITDIEHLLIIVEFASIGEWIGLFMISSLCFALIIKFLWFRVAYS